MSEGSSHTSRDGVPGSRSPITQDVLITAHTAYC